jgi:hypothetical protein
MGEMLRQKLKWTSRAKSGPRQETKTQQDPIPIYHKDHVASKLTNVECKELARKRGTKWYHLEFERI